MERRPNVLIAQYLHEPGPSLLAKVCHVRYESDDRTPPREMLAEAAPEIEGLVCHSNVRVDDWLLSRAPRLRVVATVSVGLDHIDVPACTARGVAVCNTPGTVTEATADLTFGLILSCGRRIAEGDRLVRAGGWTHWSPLLMVGVDVHGATLGIVGLGRIGAAVARRAAGFGMRILYHTRTRRPTDEAALGATWADLPTLLRESDFVSLHLPSNAATRHIIGADELALMKPTAYLVNMARGAVIDQRALYEALRDRRIAGAGLDVFDPEPLRPDDEPLAALENVVLTPHVGSASLATRRKMATTAARNAIAVLTGGTPPAIVNAEALAAARDSGARP